MKIRTDAINGSCAAEHSHRVVEAPLHSPGWSRFFTIAAYAVLFFNLWINFVGPYLVVKRAEKVFGKPGSASSLMLEIQGRQYNPPPLSDRQHNFFGNLAFSAALLYLARRLKARCALEVLSADGRAPVLYLRSFGADRLDNRLRRAQPWPQRFITEEAKLVERLHSIGPVLAIGRPGEKLSPIGAARLYVSDFDWQNIARQLMANARLLVIRISPPFLTAGLRWELACAREALPPEKVVLWFPYKLKGRGYTAVREGARETLKVELPEACLEGFVTFDADWQPMPARSEIERPEACLKGFVSFDADWKPIPAKSEICVPRDLRARPVATDLSSGEGQPSSAENSSGAVGPSLRELLEQLDVHMTAPPAFPLPPVARVAAGLWLVLLWGVPGERWSFFLSLPHFVCTLVEGATTMLLALGLAFIPYIRNPAGRLLPPFILCAVLALDGYWIVARFGKAGVNSEVPVEQVLADVATTLNANLPKQVDSETRWDTVTSGPGKRMTAFYTLVNLSVADLNQAEFIEETRKQLVGDFRSNPYLARRMEVEWTYVFRDKRGETVATIIVSPRDL